MKTLTTVDTWLPIFSGFYGTLWETDGQEEMELDNINEKRKEKGFSCVTWDDVEWDYAGYTQAAVKGITRCVGGQLKEMNLITACVCPKLVSPREYNFTNDSIDVSFTLTTENRQAINAYLLTHKEEFKKYIADRYSSYDGFFSSYSNDVNAWLSEEVLQHFHKLGAVLHFILLNETPDIEYEIYESLTRNGLYITAKNYSALIEGSK